MILHKILEHDLQKVKRESEIAPLILEIPARPSFFPAIVSSFTPGKFLVSRKMSINKYVRTGVFEYNPDNVDELLTPLMESAYNLSLEEQWPNIFYGPDSAESGFNYIDKMSEVRLQPHACLVPSSWTDPKITKWFGKSNLLENRYRKACKIYKCAVNFPIFLSRPDFVGMYTQFLGGKSSIILHNIQLSMAFCK